MSQKPLPTIATLPTPLPAEDFAALFQETRRALPEWCEGYWSDFNDHDPGLMILEQLTYAVTELAYRARLPVPTLLANGGEIPWAANSLHPPTRTLTMHPLTGADYARLIYDRIPECVYAWVGPIDATLDELGSVPGRLQALVAFEPEGAREAIGGEANELNAARPALERVRRLLGQARNLGERFDRIAEFPLHPLDVRLVVEVEPDADVHVVVAELFLAVKRALLPGPRFRPLWEAADQMPLDVALSGPRTERGVIVDADLPRLMTWAEAQARTIEGLQSVPGVKNLTSVHLGPPPERAEPQLFAPGTMIKWHVGHSTAIEVDFLRPVDGRNNDLVAANQSHELRRTLLQIQSGGAQRVVQFSHLSPPGRPVASGAVVPHAGDIASYHSIQHQFPPCFALGPGGLPPDATPSHIAQVKQLKGYLLVFEQMLANYHEQLAHTAQFFSNQPQARTMFAQPLKHVPEALPLLAAWTGGDALDAREMDARAKVFWSDPANSYLRTLDGIVESEAAFLDQRQRVLDHLLSRFNESYPTGDAATYETIANKEWILQEYPDLGFNRAASADAAQPLSWQQDRPKSGLERKIELLLGHEPVVPAAGHAASTSVPGGGFYFVIEPIRLLPSAAPSEASAGEVMSVPLAEFAPSLVHVFINWTTQPFTTAFKNYIRRLVHANAPAHLWHRFVWLEDHLHPDESDDMRQARLENLRAFRDAFAFWQRSNPAFGPLQLAASVAAKANTIVVRAETPAARLFAWLQQQPLDPAP